MLDIASMHKSLTRKVVFAVVYRRLVVAEKNIEHIVALIETKQKCLASIEAVVVADEAYNFRSFD